MNKKPIITSLIGLMLLCSCGKEVSPEMVKSEQIISTQTDITMTLENITPTSATIAIYNGGDTAIYFGSEYKFTLEQEIDGNWYVFKRAETTAEGYSITTTDIAHILEQGMTEETEVSWEILYGKLPSGRYRLIKEINIGSNSLMTPTDSIAAEFEII